MGPAADSTRLEATRLGSYEILRKIAKGGMAELFLAQTRGPEGFEKLVVLKKILPNYAENPKFVRLFLDEAKLAATLDHPHIAHVYDMGMVDGNYFFTMEYIHGQDVRSTLRRTSRMGQKVPIDHAVQIARNIAAALHYAHERRKPDGSLLDIVHRDVSPSNILISYDGAVKLVDFGVAKAATSTEKTRTGTLKGKISYMSPEQAKGAPVDRRSDIFALGIVLWELVTTQRLFKAENDLATIQMIINSKAQPPSQLRPECTPELERIILRALEPDIDKRYQTAEELQVELDELATEQKLKQSSVALRSFMQRMFDAEIQAWKEAQTAGLTLVEHVGGNTTGMTTPVSESGIEFEPDEDDSGHEEENASTFDPPTLQRDPIARLAPQSGALTVQLPVQEAPTAPQQVQFPVAPASWVPRPQTATPAEDAFQQQKKRIAIIAAIAFAGIVIIALAFGGSGNKSAAKAEPLATPEANIESPTPSPEPTVTPIPAPAPAPAPAAKPPEPPVVAPAAPPNEPPPVVAPAAKPNEPPPHVAPAAPAACNADSFDEKARTAENNGQHAVALVAMEQAIKCAPTDRRYALAFMSACNASDAAKAKLYYQKIPPANRTTLKQICARNGINLDPKPSAPKDKPKKPIDLDSATPP